MRFLKAFLLLAVMLSGSVFAVGSLYARRALSSDPGVPLWLKSYDADMTIADQMAVTHVDQVFKNETYQRMEGIMVFPLPPDAIVTEVALWINGVRVLGEVMEKDTARAVYNSIVQPQRDPALVEYVGQNVFKLSVFPIEPNGNAMSERRIEITYAELLPYDAGNIDYKFFMKTVNLSSKPVQRASLRCSLTAQQDILSFACPSHAGTPYVAITRVNNRQYQATYGNENAFSEKDLVFRYALNFADFALNHLVYVPDPAKPMFFDAAGDNPYFLLWITPPNSITQSNVIRKNLVLVADVSSSMAGTRIIQLRHALNTMVDTLNSIDGFNIVAFGTGVSKFKPDIVDVSNARRTEAHTYINQLAEGGLTNMEGALKAAFLSAWQDTCMNAVVFLTDGKPTWPTTTTAQSVIDTVARYNPARNALYAFGIGADVDTTFLSRLSAENNGSYQTIASDDSIASMMAKFMKKISYPLIRNISLNYGTLESFDVYPRVLPNLYAGSQLTVQGRFQKPVSSAITFRGLQGSREIIMRQNVDFTREAVNHPFVPCMWASAKIDYLLDQIALYGQQKELVDNVKVLGKKYGIITPYTSILVVEPGVSRVLEDKTIAMPAKFGMILVNADPRAESITIRCAIPRLTTPGTAMLRIFDARGQLVKTLMQEPVAGGNFLVRWDRRSENGSRMTAGMYIAILEVGGEKAMLRIRLL